MQQIGEIPLVGIGRLDDLDPPFARQELGVDQVDRFGKAFLQKSRGEGRGQKLGALARQVAAIDQFRLEDRPLGQLRLQQPQPPRQIDVVSKQLNLTSGNVPTNAAYVPLPQFLTMKGTLGDPKADINKLALGGMAVKSLGSGIIGTATNGAVQVGNLLNSLLKKVK